MDSFLIYSALALCVTAGLSFVLAFVSFIKKSAKAECAFGAVVLISAAISFALYYYLRIALSGGNLSDERVVFVVLVYLATAVSGIIFFIDGRKRVIAHLSR